MWRSMMALRLACVEGANRFTNDLVYCPPLHTSPSNPRTSTIIFFPGDVQNYPEIMITDRENSTYCKWNLIDVALMLRSHYETGHVLVIKPSRIEFDVYSCYDNFLRCDKYGSPLKGSYVKAVAHLEALLHNAALQVTPKIQYLDEGSSENGNTLSNHGEWNPANSEIILIGFSKGCVVLNQLMYEFCSGTYGNFLKNNITQVSWLDGGHGSTEGAWITQTDVLSTLSSFPWQFHVEVTPYQVERREWVKKEENIFSETLLRNGANIKRRLHFSSLPPSLLNHFRLLDVLYSKS